MRRSLTFVLLATLVATIPLSAQFWTKSEYTAWSKSDCEKMLQDSPWARSRRLERVMVRNITEQSKVEGGEQNPQITYTAQFYSALPLRQAIARLNVLAAKPDQAATVDERNKEFLSRKFPEQIAVRVSFSTNTPTYFRDLEGTWRTAAPSTVMQKTFLNAGKERISPVEYLPPPPGRNEFLFLFPRMKDGKPIITPDLKNISVEFEHPTIGIITTERVLIEFDLKKMMVTSELAL